MLNVCPDYEISPQAPPTDQPTDRVQVLEMLAYASKKHNAQTQQHNNISGKVSMSLDILGDLMAFPGFGHTLTVVAEAILWVRP